MRNLTVQIPTPCHERWDDMHPTERGRFCANCQKTVVDYSLLSDQELVRLLSKSSETTCGRFFNDQLNRPLVPARQQATSVWRKWISLLTLSLIGWQSALAQRHLVRQSSQPTSTQQPPERPNFSVNPIEQQATSDPDAKWVISGRIMVEDSSNTLSPVVGINVYVNGIPSFQIGEKWQTTTDSSGTFHIVVPRQERTTKLNLWPFSDKYISKTIHFNAAPASAIIMVDDIILHRMSSVRKEITGGMICVIQTPSRWQKIKQKLFR